MLENKNMPERRDAVFTREQFIDLMLQRGTAVTKTDIETVFNSIEETVIEAAVAYIVKNGGTTNLPLLNMSFSVSGVFESAIDTLDPGRHRLHIDFIKLADRRVTEE